MIVLRNSLIFSTYQNLKTFRRMFTSSKNELPSFTMESLKQYRVRSSEKKLLVIHGKVYDVTNFMHKHPGGAKVIASYLGEDATVSGSKSCCDFKQF